MQCPTETIPTKCKQCRKILYHCCCNILYCRKEALKSRVLSFSLTTLTFDNKIRHRRSEIMGSGYDASMPISSILLLAKLYKCIYQLVYRPAYLSVTTQRKHLYSHIQAYWLSPVSLPRIGLYTACIQYSHPSVSQLLTGLPFLQWVSPVDASEIPLVSRNRTQLILPTLFAK